MDIVIICPDERIVLVKRKNHPYQNYWALPGGFVECGETVENAAIREAQEETGMDIKLGPLVGVYSTPDRDPRGHVVTVCFMATYKSGEMKADTDAKDVSKFTKDELNEIKLAFDHEEILNDAIHLNDVLQVKK